MRIAMWSGPRNLSTAMMYAFGARDDCAVWDEPFYAAYLHKTGIDHPMRDEIIAAGEVDVKRVTGRILGDIPKGKTVFFQKHMCQHMLEGIDLGWTRKCVNFFLIRHPQRVIASFDAKRAQPNLDDIGFRAQARLFDRIRDDSGKIPAIVDCADIRANPQRILDLLCQEIGLPFQPGMLRWPKGGHPDDGVWGRHWYGGVHGSSSFAGPEKPLPVLPDNLRSLSDAAMPYYQRMARFKLI